RIDEHIHRANRIALVDPIIKAVRQQRRLLAIRPLNETLHHPPGFSKGTIASIGFSHGLGQGRLRPARGWHSRSTPSFGNKPCVPSLTFRAKPRHQICKATKKKEPLESGLSTNQGDGFEQR
ncbi:MAG: hypothetical protein JWP25_467, partial [Bradyrhizobium sp.]|nr:hypothetical protein [Bradyrhizobium sp.]